MSNRLTLQGARGMPAMAGLLLMGLACMPMVGCLFPQDEEVIPTLPPKRNGALRIVAQSLPEPRTGFRNTTLCLDLNPVFSLTVEDEDVGDRIHSRWFIGSTASQPFTPSSVPGGTSVNRTVTAPSALGFKSALADLETGTATLTAYVADTNFEEVLNGKLTLEPRPGPQLQLPDGGIEIDKGSFDTFTWTLDVVPCN